MNCSCLLLNSFVSTGCVRPRFSPADYTQVEVVLAAGVGFNKADLMRPALHKNYLRLRKRIDTVTGNGDNRPMKQTGSEL